MQENTERTHDSASPSLPPITYPKEVVDDLRERLTEAEKKLKSARKDNSELRAWLREAESIDPEPKVVQIIHAFDNKRDWFDSFVAYLTNIGIVQETECRICHLKTFWAFNLRKKKYKMLSQNFKQHYHEAEAIQEARAKAQDGPIPVSFQAPLSARQRALMKGSEGPWGENPYEH